MQRSHISGWWYLLPLVLLLGIVGQAAIESHSISSRTESTVMKTFPELTSGEISSRVKAVVAKIKQPRVDANVETYFQTLAEIYYLQAALRRLNQTEGLPMSDSRGGSGPRADSILLTSLGNDLANSYQPTGVLTANPAATTRAREKYFDPVMAGIDQPTSPWPVMLPFLKSYPLIALLVAPLFFFLRLRRGGNMVIPELLYLRLPLWSLLWPVGLFKYPVNINVVEQMRRFKQWLAATVSMLLGMSPIAMAHAKAGSGNFGGAEVVQVESTRSAITVKDPPKPQITPTLVAGDVEFNVHGWAHLETSAENDEPRLAMLKLRALADVGNFHLFSQWDPRRDMPIDEIWVAYGSSTLTVKVGHIFHPAASVDPAPFKRETVSPPHLPVAFFGTGVEVSGALNDNTSFAIDVTGDSRAKPFSGQMFNRLEVSGNLKRVHEGGFIRLSAQQAGDLRVILDGEHQFGPNKVRAAVHYRTKDDQVGGYVFLSREVSKTVKVFTQFELENERFHALAGLRWQANDNLDFTVEASNDNDWAIRARGRF
jgi:hypothetical protein